METTLQPFSTNLTFIDSSWKTGPLDLLQLWIVTDGQTDIASSCYKDIVKLKG